MKRILLWFGILATVGAIAGCGGGGGPVRSVPVKVMIDWAARGRTVDAPSSALSVVITVKRANPAGGDFTFTINRDADPSEYTREYISTTGVAYGTWLLNVQCYAGMNGTGDLVGAVGQNYKFGPEAPEVNLTSVKSVASVEVVPGQTVGVGEFKDLAFTARSASGALVMVSPGSVRFSIMDGADKLSFLSQQAVGISVGTAMVQTTLDWHTSSAAAVSVTKSAAFTATLTPQLADWADSGNFEQTDSNYVRTSGQARYVLSTDADDLSLNVYCDIFDDIGNTYPGDSAIGVRVTTGGVTTEYNLICTLSGRNTLTTKLPAGTKTVEIVQGSQSAFDKVRGTWLVSATLIGGSFARPVPPTPVNKLIVYGDSIAAGANSTYPAMQGWLSLLRQTYPGDVQSEAWGVRSLNDDVQNGLPAFVEHLAQSAPAKIWLAIGTNDYLQNRWKSSEFGAAYADLLDSIHGSMPGCMLYCQTPTVEASEAPNSFGESLSAYRAAIAAAVASRPWAQLVDGTTILSTTDLVEGVHPSNDGHMKYAAFVSDYLARTSRGVRRGQTSPVQRSVKMRGPR